MKWYRRLYLGESVTGNRDELIKKIEKNAGTPGTYLVTLAANGRDLFDLFSTNMLFWPALHGHCPMIVGIAGNYEEAVKMAADIALAAYHKTGGFDMVSYLQSQLQTDGELYFEYPMERLRKRKFFRFRKTDGR